MKPPGRTAGVVTTHRLAIALVCLSVLLSSGTAQAKSGTSVDGIVTDLVTAFVPAGYGRGIEAMVGIAAWPSIQPKHNASSSAWA